MKLGQARTKGRLFICGLGVDRPYDASLRTMEVLKSCDYVVYIHGDGQRLRPFLKQFCANLILKDDLALGNLSDPKKNSKTGKAICTLLKKGARVAYVTYGHPFIFSDGFNMADYCARRGFTAAAVCASSAADSILAALPNPEIASAGYTLCHAREMLEHAQELCPRLCVFLLGVETLVREGLFGALCRELARRYPPKHAVYLIRCRDGQNDEFVETASIHSLPRASAKIGHMVSLVIAPHTRGR